MRLEDDVVLEPQELCDLTNYVLGYSVADRFSRRIDVFVVKTWPVERGRRVQHWCEEVLRLQGVLERKVRPVRHERDRGGRRISLLVPPHEIRYFCGSAAEVARIVGVDKETLLRWRWAKDQDDAYSQGQQGTQHA
jgi:hypothetical protein